jgi:sialic acid synthase SpsE
MKFNKEINIKDKLISMESPTFVIAEAGVNHGGDMAVAKKLIDLAVDAKADAVKFQTFKAEHLILSDIQKAPYQKGTTDASESQYDMLKRLEVSREQNLELKQYCPNSRHVKLKGLCKTRWFERHSCLETFGELYEYVVTSLDAMVNPHVYTEVNENR